MNISYLEPSTDVPIGCCQATPRIGGSFVLMASGLSLTVSARRRSSSSLEIGLQPGQSQIFCSVRPVFEVLPVLQVAAPGNWPVCCNGANKTSLCGVIPFAIGLTEKVNSCNFFILFYCCYDGFCYCCWCKSFRLYCCRFQNCFCVPNLFSFLSWGQWFLLCLGLLQ